MRRVVALLSLVIVGSAIGIVSGAAGGWLIAKFAEFLFRHV